MTRVALAGCASLVDPEQPLLLAALDRVGVSAEGIAWDADVDWSSYDLVVVRSTWDYTERLDEFLRWADSVPRLANSSDVLRWNTDKHYLAELARRGVPVVPTTYVDGSFEPPRGDFVIKPTVSAAAIDTRRYRPDDAHEAAEHVSRLQEQGRGVMVQPYLAEVEAAGETSLLFLGGEYSHGARKGAVLAGGEPISPEDYEIAARTPSAAERALAEQVLAAAPGPLLYARVDLLPTPEGPVLLELELTEPFLFLGTSDGAADRFAAAIASWT